MSKLLVQPGNANQGYLRPERMTSGREEKVSATDKAFFEIVSPRTSRSTFGPEFVCHEFKPLRLGPGPASVYSAQRAAGLAELERLTGLDSNWDGEGAVSISQRVVENAKFALLALLGSGRSPEIFPNSNGTVSLEWEARPAAHLEVGLTSFSMYVTGPTQSDYFSGAVTDLARMAPAILAALAPSSRTIPSYARFAGFIPAYLHGWTS